MPHPTCTFPKAFSIWFGLLLAILLPTRACAQDSITAYSDTVSVLEDAVADSTRHLPAPAPWQAIPIDHLFESIALPDFLSSIFGLTGMLLALCILVFFLLPLLVVGLAIYLIYRSNREKKRRIEEMSYDPERKTVDEHLRNRLLQESAIKYACWGVGVILTEWIIGLTSLLYVIGVALLCIAAGNWLNSRIGRKKE